MNRTQLAIGDRVLVVGAVYDDLHELSQGTIHAVGEPQVDVVFDVDPLDAPTPIDSEDVWYVLRESEEFAPEMTWHRLESLTP